jgi:glyoxylate/hydroxypyruvate reductase
MIVIASSVKEIEKILLDSFQQYAPAGSFCMLDDVDAIDATTAACWFPHIEQLKELPKLELIHSMAAGVEHLDLAALSGQYKVCRIVDASHKQGMLSYLLWGVLYYQRYFDQYLLNQRQAIWHQFPQLQASDIHIGIMGMGELGAYVGQEFSKMGYHVLGWSKNLKYLDGIQSFAGQDEFPEFLSKTQILINLLPLTNETIGILSKTTFQHLPQGAVIINSGRGAHLLPDDLLEQLRAEHLRGAILDVFPEEPLDKNHVLWRSEGVVVTPHIASHASLKTVVEQIVENDERLMNKQKLMNQIDLSRGY